MFSVQFIYTYTYIVFSKRERERGRQREQWIVGAREVCILGGEKEKNKQRDKHSGVDQWKLHVFIWSCARRGSRLNLRLLLHSHTHTPIDIDAQILPH